MKNLAPIFRGQIENGELKLAQPDLFKKYLSSLRGECEIIVRKWKKRRVITQNALYWGYLRMIEEETGNQSVYLHEYFKKIFLPPKHLKIFGKETEVPISTTELSTVEFANYLKKIEIETGLPIPDKNKFDF